MKENKIDVGAHNCKCECVRTKCIRHGNCKLCIEYHKNKKYKTYCKKQKNDKLK
jgi:hypothetical protein